MSRRLVITRIDAFGRQPLISALCEDHELLEAQGIPQNAPAQILNNIYVARVSKVVKQIDAAFVEIEKGRMCFLPLSDANNPVFVKQLSKDGRIVQGDELLVQIVREAVKTKDPQVTCQLSLPGSYCVVTNQPSALGISKKLGEEDRQRLKKAVCGVFDERLGLIVRTNAAQAKEQLLLDEIKRLQEQLLKILHYAPYQKTYALLYKAVPEYVRILQNQPLEGPNAVEHIVTDEMEVYQALLSFSDDHTEYGLSEKLQLYKDAQLDLKNLYSLQQQLDKALQKKVWLSSGANLVIEPTEALTVIDVNSAKHIGREKSKQHLQVNLEAAREIAKQLRLRNLSGIILIDFIDMEDDEDKLQLLHEMKRLVGTDSVKTEVVDMTRLGLMELTRKKVRKPLLEQLGIKKIAESY